MTTVVVFHSVLGLRPAALATAERLRVAGHTVHTPDLYGGPVFDDMEAAAAHFEALGPAEMIARTELAHERIVQFRPVVGVSVVARVRVVSDARASPGAAPRPRWASPGSRTPRAGGAR